VLSAAQPATQSIQGAFGTRIAVKNVAADQEPSGLLLD
jgi:hypothetical protein